MDIKPIQIRNPKVEVATVRLRPNQDAWLSLSPEMDVREVDFESDFFSLSDECVEQGGVRTYIFSQKFDLTEWAAISTVYLGDIYLCRKKTISTISLFLDSPKSEVVTVINPKGTQLRLRPSQTLEVVIYSNKIGGDWVAKVKPGSCDISYTQRRHITINPQKFSCHPDAFPDEFIPYPRILDVNRQDHFWFKMNTFGMRVVWPTGIYEAGSIWFGEKDSSVTPSYAVHLNLKVKLKDRKKTTVTTIVSKYTGWFSPMVEDISLKRKKTFSLFEGCKVFLTDVTKKKRLSDDRDQVLK